MSTESLRAVRDHLSEVVDRVEHQHERVVVTRNGHAVGKQLREDLAGIWSARRGTYRVLYRINDDAREAVVLRIEHRRDAYRPM